MKKVSLFLFAFLGTIGLSAQGTEASLGDGNYLAPGTIYIGGSAGFTGTGEKMKTSSTTTDGPSITQFNILPEVGYVLTDNIAVSLGIGYNNYTYKYNQTGFLSETEYELKDKSGMFMVNPMVKMIKQVNNRFYCVPTFGVSLGFGNSSDQSLDYNVNDNMEEIVTDEYKDFSWGLSFRPTIKYFLTEHFALSFAYGNLYYNSHSFKSKENEDNKDIVNSYGIDLNLSSIQFGMLYTF
jgi:hypothetical protein